MLKKEGALAVKKWVTAALDPKTGEAFNAYNEETKVRLLAS